jgi:hypothetical protein
MGFYLYKGALVFELRIYNIASFPVVELEQETACLVTIVLGNRTRSNVSYLPMRDVATGTYSLLVVV